MLTDRSGVSWLLMFVTILGVVAPLTSEQRSGDVASAAVPIVSKPETAVDAASVAAMPAATLSTAIQNSLSCSSTNGKLECTLLETREATCPTAKCTEHIYDTLHAYGIRGSAAALDECDQPERPIERWSKHQPELHFMVATIPDPFESGQKHEFDRALDAAVRAVESAGYLRDHFYLPWSEGARKDECGDKVPGIWLFRHPDRPNELLGLLLVGETPTSGPARAPLDVALSLAAAFPVRRGELALLGPYFSGSGGLIVDAIGQWEERWLEQRKPTPDRYVVRTGTASALPLQILRARLPKLDIAALTLPVATLLDAYAEFLEQRFGRDALDRVALLAEEGTAYGQSQAKPTPIHPGASLPPLTMVQAATIPKDHVTFDPTIMRFPRNIGELRSRWDDRRGARSEHPKNSLTDLATPTFLRANYDDAAARDQPVSLSDETCVSDDLVLTAQLKSLAQHHVWHIGIVASSVADVIFLARQIRIYLPDARLFVVQSDQLLTHPEHEASLLGMTVVSSYPLANYGADWIYPFFPVANTTERFSRSSAHGVYNAARALIAGAPVVPGLSAYAMPFLSPDPGTETRPGIWISAIGHGGMWPLSISPSPASSEYTLAARVAEPDGGGLECDSLMGVIGPTTSWPVGVTLALLICGVIVFAYAFAALDRSHLTGELPEVGRSGSRLAEHPFHVFECFRPRAYVASEEGPREEARGLGSQLLLSGALCVLLATLLALTTVSSMPFWIPNACPRLARSSAGVWTPTLVGAVLSVGLVVSHMWAQQQLLRSGSAQDIRNWFIDVGMLIGATVLSALLVLRLVVSRADSAASLIGELVVLYTRITALTSRLSPLGPLLLTATVWFLTASVYLERSRILSAARLKLPDGSETDLVMRLAATLVPTSSATVLQRLDEVVRKPLTRRNCQVAVFFLILIPSALVMLKRPTTLEGPVANWGLVFLAVMGFVFSAFNLTLFVALWTAFSRFLRELAFEPPVSLDRMSELAKQTFALPWIGGFVNKHQVRMLRKAAASLLEIAPAKFEREARAKAAEALERPVTMDSVHWDPKLACALVPVVSVFTRLTLHDLKVESSSDPIEALRKPVLDEFMVGSVSLVVSYVAQQLRNLLGLMLVSALLMAIAVNWYPVEPRRLLTTLNWFMVVSVLLLTLVVFVKTEQHEVLRHLRGKESQWLLADRKFMSQILVWIVVPFLAFLVSQYPASVGGIFDSFTSLSPLGQH